MATCWTCAAIFDLFYNMSAPKLGKVVFISSSEAVFCG
jgi:hypothetical protein